MNCYTIGGKKKKRDINCKSCLGGEAFEDGVSFKLDGSVQDFKEFICGECLSKYKVFYRKPVFKIDCDEQIVDSSLVENFDVSQVLTVENSVLFSLAISCLVEEGLEKLSEIELDDLLIKKDLVEEFGDCKHNWTTFHINTPIGQVDLFICRVCLVGRMVYDGKEYFDNPSNLLKFLGVKTGKVSRSSKRLEKELLPDVVNLIDGEVLK